MRSVLHRRPGRAVAAGLGALVLAAGAWPALAQPAPQAPPRAAAGVAPATPAAPELRIAPRGSRHALIIGIGQYDAPEIPALKGVGHDMASARRMAQAMAVPEANITMLRDGEATAARIRRELQALESRMAEGDRLFVYWSGHGTRWLDREGENAGRCTEGLLAGDGRTLTNVELGRALAPLARRADKMLVFYDACYSGGIAGAPLQTTRARSLGAEVLTPKFTRVGAADACSQPSNFRSRSIAAGLEAPEAAAIAPVNLVHVAASRPDEVSFDSSTSGGFATVAWRDCLLGEARDLDASGAITVDEVTACAQARVDQRLDGQPGITGQRMTVTGNRSFVPAYLGAPATIVAAAAAAVTPPPSPPAAAPAAPAAAPPPVAAPPVAAPSTPAELLAEIHRQRDAGRAVTVTTSRRALRIGVDPLELTVRSPRDGYLYLALAGSDGKSLYLLYPNALAPDNRVRAGQAVVLPGRGWEIVAAGPPGTETLLAIVADAPRDIGALAAEPSGPFMKTLLDAAGRARLQSLLADGAPIAGCSAGRDCPTAFGSALLQLQTLR